MVEVAGQPGLPAAVAAAATCRARAATQPYAVVELRRQLGMARLRDALREAYRVRYDQPTGPTCKQIQELPRPVRGRWWQRTMTRGSWMPERESARCSSTGFASWEDESALDRWAAGDVFADPDTDLPGFYLRGHHTEPEGMVLANTEYRQAYAGKLARRWPH